MALGTQPLNTPSGQTDPWQGQDPNNVVQGWYQTYLHRGASPDEVSQWANNGLGLGGEQYVASSPEAQQWTAAHPAGQAPGTFVNTSPLANTGSNSPYDTTVTPTNPSVPGTGNPNFGGALTLDQLKAIQASGGMDPNSPNAKALAAAIAAATPAKGGGGGGLITPFQGQFAPPPLQAYPTAPQFTPPTYTAPPAFQAPTAEQAANMPGYQFAQQQGQLGVERSAAARGVLNTGGTLKDLANYNQQLAATQYGNVYGQALNQYQQNYTTQYLDPYKNAYTAALDAFSPKLSEYGTQMANVQRANEVGYQQAFDLYQQQYKQYLDNIYASQSLANT